MKKFNYKISRTMDKHEFDKGMWSPERLDVMDWLFKNIGPGGLLPSDDRVWTHVLEYPGPHLITESYYFVDPNDAALFALKWS